MKKGGLSVLDLSKTFEELNKHSVDQVILRTRANRMEKPKRKTSSVSDYEQDLGYSPLTEETRAWILAGAKNDEARIRSLLNTNPKIYSTRDPTTGYTCLHWAAKYGNESLIHLLIGRYRMNPNIRTRGGYTPLMLSAQHDKQAVYSILQNTYGADPNLRDYSGRKAGHYLKESPDFPDENLEEEDEMDSVGVRSLQRSKAARVDRGGTTFLLKELLRDPTPRSKQNLTKSNHP